MREGVSMKSRYTSGFINICFMALGIEHATTLLNNGFDTMTLCDSATGTVVELEITSADLDMLELTNMDGDTETLI